MYQQMKRKLTFFRNKHGKRIELLSHHRRQLEKLKRRFKRPKKRPQKLLQVKNNLKQSSSYIAICIIGINIGKEDEMKPFIMKLEDDDWRDIAYSKALYIPHDLHKELEAKKMFRPKSINGKKKCL